MSIANEQEFNRYSISLADFEKASECVAEARKHLPNDLVFEALNKALAHSEFAFNPTSLNPRSGVISSKPFSLLTQQIDLDGLAKLLKKLEDACHSERATYVHCSRLNLRR